jgi:hypothetical protein
MQKHIIIDPMQKMEKIGLMQERRIIGLMQNQWIPIDELGRHCKRFSGN